MTSVRNGVSRTLAVILALAAMLLFTKGFTASADTDYIKTYKEYKDAGLPVSTWNEIADAMELLYDAAEEYYDAGDTAAAKQCFTDAYYGYYETTGFERAAMSYISGSEKTEAELLFSKCKKSAVEGSADGFKSDVQELRDKIRYQANKLDGVDSNGNSTGGGVKVGGGGGGIATFFACFGIILREGLEAILVVGAIIAYLVKSGNKDKLKVVYAGCVLAIIASFVSAWLLNLLKLANSANQEIIEGVTALIAVVVLFYVSNWMVSKAESEAWTKYIDQQVKFSAETGSVFTLGFTAFLAVFREGAEVILFYQPLISDKDSVKMMWGGFFTGCVVLVFVFLIIRFFSVKLPIRPFFLGTSILMFIMSISFLGSGIKELIEGDVLGVTSPDWLAKLIPYNDVLDVLGIYPIVETLLPQLILIVITIMIFVMSGYKEKNKKEAGILAVIFGSLGMHKFYTGKYGQGMLYAIFCWTGIPTLVGIMEGVHILTGSDEQFEVSLMSRAEKKAYLKKKAKVKDEPKKYSEQELEAVAEAAEQSPSAEANKQSRQNRQKKRRH
ncbi:MAG: FTR1 family protein [Ruminococcus sp.]|nr:FTR1 family protein [Ruminococcus sp.]